MTIDDCVLPWQDTLSQSLVAGCDCVQIREKNISTADLLSHTNKVKDIATRFGAHVVVNDRVDIMMATGIHGVHLGQEDMPIAEARKLCGCEFVIGATAHTTDEIDRAVLQGADYVGVGSMFPSNTKPNVPVAPLGLLKHALAYNHLAIGGITQSNTHTLYESGCKGIAVSSAISQSTEPEKIVKNLLQPEHQSA